MNGRKAKQIRKLIYKTDDFRVREYGQVKGTNQIINVGQLEQVGNKENPKQIAKRRVYQHIKNIARRSKIVNISREIFA